MADTERLRTTEVIILLLYEHHVFYTVAAV